LTAPASQNEERKRCADCDAFIARDHLDDDYCTSCQHKLRSLSAPNPPGRSRAPRPDLTEAVADLLMARRGQWLDLGELLGVDARTIAAAVRRLKDHGFLIKGDKARGGYFCEGWRDPRRQGRYCYRGHRRGCAPSPDWPDEDEDEADDA
jgi:hypothetical protein